MRNWGAFGHFTDVPASFLDGCVCSLPLFLLLELLLLDECDGGCVVAQGVGRTDLTRERTEFFSRKTLQNARKTSSLPAMSFVR